MPSFGQQNQTICPFSNMSDYKQSVINWSINILVKAKYDSINKLNKLIHLWSINIITLTISRKRKHSRLTPQNRCSAAYQKKRVNHSRNRKTMSKDGWLHLAANTRLKRYIFKWRNCRKVDGPVQNIPRCRRVLYQCVCLPCIGNPITRLKSQGIHGHSLIMCWMQTVVTFGTPWHTNIFTIL